MTCVVVKFSRQSFFFLQQCFNCDSTVFLRPIHNTNEHMTISTGNHTYEVTDGEHGHENEVFNGVSRLVNGGCPMS